MIEVITQLLLTLVAPIIVAYLKYRFESDDKPVKDSQFKELEKLLDIGIDSTERIIIEYRFYKFFKHRFKYDQIQLLLKSTNPLHLFRIFSRASKFVEVSNDGLHFKFKDKFKSKKFRKRYARINLIKYIFFSTIGFYPILNAEEIISLIGGNFISIIIIPILFIILAIIFLDESFKIGNAEDLISDFKKI